MQPCLVSKEVCFTVDFQAFMNFVREKNNLFFLQHNLATSVDKEKVLEAYNDVMSDAKADINWLDRF